MLSADTAGNSTTGADHARTAPGPDPTCHTAGPGRRRAATLGGCRFRQKGGLVTVTREARAAGGAVSPGTLWDGRWEVQAASGEVRGEIRALGADGLRQCGDWRASGLPRQVLEVTPGVWQGDRLLAAPCAGFGTIAATTRPGFHAFLLSH